MVALLVAVISIVTLVTPGVAGPPGLPEPPDAHPAATTHTQAASPARLTVRNESFRETASFIDLSSMAAIRLKILLTRLGKEESQRCAEFSIRFNVLRAIRMSCRQFDFLGGP
jgi:hypothetical protein